MPRYPVPVRSGRAPAAPLHAGAFELDAATVAARFRWARRRGHPHYLWPDVAPEAWLACLREIERATAAVLHDPGAMAPRPPAHGSGTAQPTITDATLAGRHSGHGADAAGRRADRDPRAAETVELAVPAPAGPRAMGVAAFSAGMGPLLGYWLGTGRLRTDPATAAVLSVHLDHGRRRAAILRRVLETAIAVLADAGVRPIVLKGSHSGTEYFPEPGTRPAADVDLLVAPDLWEAACRALATAGYGVAGRRKRPRRDEWIPPGAPRAVRSLELAHADDPYTLEVHDALDRDFFGVRRVALPLDPARDPAAWPVAGRAAAVLPPPLNVAFLALHASEEWHRLQLLRVVELAAVIRRETDRGRLDWDRVAASLEGADAWRFAYPALSLAEKLAPGTVEAGVLARAEGAATRRMRRVVAGVTPATAPHGDRRSLDTVFMWAEGPVEAARRAAYLLWPHRARGSLRAAARLYADRWYRVMGGRS